MTAAPLKESAQEQARKWNVFLNTIVIVLGVSILTILIAVAAVTAVQMGGLARKEQARKASDIAHFMARTAFVPVSLGETPTLERAVNVYLDDPDLVGITILDSEGQTLWSHGAQSPPGSRWLVGASSPIVPPEEAWSGSASNKPVGLVKVTLSLSRVYGVVNRSILLIALLLAMALAAELTFIFRMTRRLRDLVGEAALAEKLQRANQELEAASTLKSGLMSLMSHEFNNAIAVLKMTVFLMKEDQPNPPERLKDNYEIFGRVLLNMEFLTRNFLDNARIEAGRLTLNLESVNLGLAIEETIKAFSPILQQRSLTVIVDSPPIISKVLVDRAALALILSNLIGNAVKYTSDHGRITVKVEHSKLQASSVRISISDTGIGIGPKDREKIFEGFVRLPEGKIMAKGFGLGLKTVHDLLQLHGTHLDLESEIGKGSTFSFVLPLAET